MNKVKEKELEEIIKKIERKLEAKKEAKRAAEIVKEKAELKACVKRVFELDKKRKAENKSENEEYLTIYSNVGNERPPLKTVLRLNPTMKEEINTIPDEDGTVTIGSSKRETIQTNNYSHIILPNAFGAVKQTNHSQNTVVKINVHFPSNKRKGADDLIIIRLIALGYSAIEIGKIVGLSNRTIEKMRGPFSDIIIDHFNISYDAINELEKKKDIKIAEKIINHFHAQYQPEIVVCLKQRLSESDLQKSSFELQKLQNLKKKLNISGAE